MSVVIKPESNSASLGGDLEPADEVAVRALLARANLLRMRRQWDEAVAACTEALRQHPRSAGAHSLLGDIYEAQGKSEDALQWYSMALEIDPANAADRAKLERVTESQRIRLRTQDIAAAAQSPVPKQERTLEWFDRVFPPGRSDSVARLILALSLGFAAVIVLCTAFIYFFIAPHRETTSAGTNADRSASDLAMPSSPVLMAPSGTAPTQKETTPSFATGSATNPTASESSSGTNRSVANNTASVPATVATTADPATLRARLSPLLDSTDMRVAGVTPGPNGALYLDLALPAATEPEGTDRLRERALRAATAGVHALTTLVSLEMDHAFVRIAVATASGAAHSPTAGRVATPAKPFAMVFAAEVFLRDFRDANVAQLTAADLAGRFQGAQWYSTTPGATNSSPADMVASGTSATGATGNASVSGSTGSGAIPP